MRVILKIAKDNRETIKQDAIDNTIPSTSRSHSGPFTILARNNNLDT
jgi:hypothetical protein